MKHFITSTLFALAILFYTTSVQAQTFSNAPDLEQGMTHPFVVQIQKFLNSSGYVVNPVPTEPGSPGYESDFFGSMTQKALSLFQSSNNIAPAQGYFGPKTKAKMEGGDVAQATGGTLAASNKFGYTFDFIIPEGFKAQGGVATSWTPQQQFGFSPYQDYNQLWYNFETDGYGCLLYTSPSPRDS